MIGQPLSYDQGIYAYSLYAQSTQPPDGTIGSIRTARIHQCLMRREVF